MGGGAGLLAALFLGISCFFVHLFAQFLHRRDFFGCVDEILKSGNSLSTCLYDFTQLENVEKKNEVVPTSSIAIIFSFTFIYACSLLSVFLFSQPFWEPISSTDSVQGVVLFALVPVISARTLTLPVRRKYIKPQIAEC